jgi:phosphatidylserine decarboxylase
LSILYSIARYLPLKTLSRATGVLSRLSIPRPLRGILYGSFSKFYGLKVHEAENDITEYDSFSSFFTRNLKPGIRPIGSGMVSSVDGTLLEFGCISNDTLIQAKGLTYSLDALIPVPEIADLFRSGSYACAYLAPGDYHHIHSPLEGDITSAIYIPGRLLPVSLSAMRSVPSLYCSNERIITLLKSDDALGFCAVVKVGATNVGSIGLEYRKEFVNGVSKAQTAKNGFYTMKISPELHIQKGARLGTFYLGSTVIILTEKECRFSSALSRGSKLMVGQSLESGSST